MPIPGNSEIALLAYWPGNPTGVSMSELNILQGTVVFDFSTPSVWQKTSTTDNSAFNLLAGNTITGSISVTGNVTAGGNVAAAGSILSSSPSAGVGYKIGAGGAVTQITSNVTGVTLNKITGQITTVALSLAAGASAVFTVTNAECAAVDVPVVSSVYAGTGTLVVSTKNVTAGTFDITLQNIHATAALNALAVINFALIKGAVS